MGPFVLGQLNVTGHHLKIQVERTFKSYNKDLTSKFINCYETINLIILVPG
jgi:hypothetical protein